MNCYNVDSTVSVDTNLITLLNCYTHINSGETRTVKKCLKRYAVLCNSVNVISHLIFTGCLLTKNNLIPAFVHKSWDYWPCEICCTVYSIPCLLYLSKFFCLHATMIKTYMHFNEYFVINNKIILRYVRRTKPQHRRHKTCHHIYITG